MRKEKPSYCIKKNGFCVLFAVFGVLMDFAAIRANDLALFINFRDVAEIEGRFNLTLVKPILVLSEIRTLNGYLLIGIDLGVEIALSGVWAMAFLDFGMAAAAFEGVVLAIINQISGAEGAISLLGVAIDHSAHHQLLQTAERLDVLHADENRRAF